MLVGQVPGIASGDFRGRVILLHRATPARLVRAISC
jgi:hypothetical protein